MSSKSPSKESEPTNQNTQPSSENTTTTTTTTTNKNNENQPSLLSRIQNSASSLIQDSVTKPSGATLSSDLAHVLDSGNKASSSSASFSGLTYSGQTWRSNGLGNGGSSLGNQNEYTSGLSEGFRSRQADSGGRALDVSEFDSFQYTGGFFDTQEQDDLMPETSHSDTGKGKGKGKSREHPLLDTYDNGIDHRQDTTMIPDINDDYESSHFSAYEMAWINASRSGTVYRSTSTTSTPSKRMSQSDINTSTPQTQVQAQNGNEHDGAEVVSLLSDPSFQPGLVTWDKPSFGSGLGFDLNLDFDDDPLDKEGFPHTLAQGLSPAEMQILDLFRKQQPHYQHDTHQTDHEKEVKKITAYSLVPDIDSFLSTTSTSTSTSKADDDALRNEVITKLIGAEEWLNVDERYNDEVWGYLRPAVEAAAAEIQQQKEEGKSGQGDGDGPAVKRLKMILRHMARL